MKHHFIIAAGALIAASLTAAGPAAACRPASGPPLSEEQYAAEQTAFQSGLWTRADTVMVASVTEADVVDRMLQVTLTPTLTLKGEAASAPFVVSDRTTNCRPGGMMGAGAVTPGEVYIVYRTGDGDLVVHQDNLTDSATRAAWDTARGERGAP